MTSSFWIKQVKASRDDGTISQIDFTPGLNTVIGYSNTGKTRIAKSILWVFGSGEVPFTEASKYTLAEVTLITPHGEVHLSREARRGKPVKINSTDPRIASGTYTLGDKSKNPLNHALLQLLEIDPARKIVKNQHFQKVNITWDILQHLFFVRETQIGRPTPSLLFPKSVSEMTKTMALSALLLLLQDEKFDKLASSETVRERKARVRAIQSFIYQQLDRLEPEIVQAEEAQALAEQQGLSVQQLESKLREELESIMHDRDRLLNDDAILAQQIDSNDDGILALEALVSQRRTLLSQLHADRQRLEFQLEDTEHDQQEHFGTQCAFCHQPVEAETLTSEERDTIQEESERLQRIATEVSQNLNELQNELLACQKKREQLRAERERIQASLANVLNPAKQRVEESLHALTVPMTARIEFNELTSRREMFDAALRELETPPPPVELYRPLEHFDTSFFYLMREQMRTALESMSFVGARNVDFNRTTFDIEVSGYSKEVEQGKGYCAYLNTVLILAFHKYLQERCSEHDPAFLLIDSPLHGFNPGKNDSLQNMGQELFKWIKTLATDRQIIILENIDKTEHIPHEYLGKHYFFSKDRNHGRYGFLEDVYDVAEENIND